MGFFNKKDASSEDRPSRPGTDAKKSPHQNHQDTVRSNPTLRKMVKNCDHPVQDYQPGIVDGWSVVSCGGCGHIISQRRIEHYDTD
jgi:hypothetical protein